MKKTLLLASLLTLSTSALADVVAEQPFARAVPPGQPNSAAFVTLKNTGNQNLQLMSANSEVAATVELHTHTNDGGVMRMRKVDQIDLPAGEITELKPGGLHIMLIGLKQTLAVGDRFDISLNFSDGSTHVVTMPVQEVMPMMKHGHQHHSMPAKAE